MDAARPSLPPRIRLPPLRPAARSAAALSARDRIYAQAVGDGSRPRSLFQSESVAVGPDDRPRLSAPDFLFLARRRERCPRADAALARSARLGERRDRPRSTLTRRREAGNR